MSTYKAIALLIILLCISCSAHKQPVVPIIKSSEIAYFEWGNNIGNIGFIPNYGKSLKTREIICMGGCNIQVDSMGMIYVLDLINKNIKVLDDSEAITKVKRVIQLPSDWSSSNMYVSPNGNVYVPNKTRRSGHQGISTILAFNVSGDSRTIDVPWTDLYYCSGNIINNKGKVLFKDFSGTNDHEQTNGSIALKFGDYSSTQEHDHYKINIMSHILDQYCTGNAKHIGDLTIPLTKETEIELGRPIVNSKGDILFITLHSKKALREGKYYVDRRRAEYVAYYFNVDGHLYGKIILGNDRCMKDMGDYIQMIVLQDNGNIIFGRNDEDGLRIYKSIPSP